MREIERSGDPSTSIRRIVARFAVSSLFKRIVGRLGP